LDGRLGPDIGVPERNFQLSLDPDRARARADAAFKKEQQLREGEKAMAEYLAAQRATREKTARLRALRLARDAAAADKSPAKKQ
jgi:hypothetical protein